VVSTALRSGSWFRPMKRESSLPRARPRRKTLGTLVAKPSWVQQEENRHFSSIDKLDAPI
jgi:hypothetical protein